ncbi:hypothetical protein ANAEL_04959 [Anaerolineales bacterium]|nr:hypothetical protein ANAEL_04959 [Anaerolineales bacterium]
MSRDLRKYMRDTNVRLIAGAMLLLFIVGDGLIWVIYGPGAAVMGLLCILAALVPVVLILLLLALSDWIVKRANRD